MAAASSGVDHGCFSEDTLYVSFRLVVNHKTTLSLLVRSFFFALVFFGAANLYIHMHSLFFHPDRTWKRPDLVMVRTPVHTYTHKQKPMRNDP